jgi:hypothetical protein
METAMEAAAAAAPGSRTRLRTCGEQFLPSRRVAVLTFLTELVHAVMVFLTGLLLPH